MKIYVGNMPYSVTEEDLKQSFEAFGQVTSVTIIKDKMSGQSKGFGFVEMGSDAEAQAAINGMNGQPLEGRPTRHSPAAPWRAVRRHGATSATRPAPRSLRRPTR